MKSRLLSGLVLACLAAVMLSVPVLGHADLVESDPPDGGTIETEGGYTLTATFTEELVAESSILIRNAAGDEVASGGVDPQDATVLTAELSELVPGDYVARWTATTADGFSERGNINFTVEVATASPTPMQTPSREPSEAPTDVPTASQAPTASVSAAPITTPAPSASPGPTDPTASNNDIILALVLAGIAVGGVVAFIFIRGRR